MNVLKDLFGTYVLQDLFGLRPITAPIVELQSGAVPRVPGDEAVVSLRQERAPLLVGQTGEHIVALGRRVFLRFIRDRTKPGTMGAFHKRTAGNRNNHTTALQTQTCHSILRCTFIH